MNGTGFMPGARVKIGGVDATDGLLASTTLVGVALGHPVGPADVTVTNLGGRSVTLSGRFTYHRDGDGLVGADQSRGIRLLAADRQAGLTHITSMAMTSERGVHRAPGAAHS